MAAGLENVFMCLVEKMAVFKNETWTNINQVNICLKLASDSLHLLSYETHILSLKLTKQMKGCIKDNIILIAYEDQGVLNKLKMKINFSEIERIRDELNKHFPMQVITTLNTEDCSQMAEPNIQETLRNELQRQTNYDNLANLFPPGFKLDEFIKNCIIDPTFPDLVDEVEKSIQKILH